MGTRTAARRPQSNAQPQARAKAKGQEVAANENSEQALKDELERLKKENEELKKGGPNLGADFQMRVSEKGAVSVYLRGARFPTTLYKQQWEKILNHAQDLKDFIRVNEAVLKVKEQQ